jgi:aminoglycoside phosphotransferase (APT) family kinase protein
VGAIEAAVKVATEFGVQVKEPVSLRSTNNTVVWLRPAMIVAKVGVGHHRRLANELGVALELTGLGGPAPAPASEIPQLVHRCDGFEITFWRYYPQPPGGATISSRQLARALRRLHASLGAISPGMRARLPSFLEELGAVRVLLTDASRLELLSEDDRLLLLHAFDRLAAELQTTVRSGVQRVIHGSPHRRNVLLADGEPRFIDFETVCVGPIEWDLAHLGKEVALDYGEALNRPLERACRDMASVKTAAWCWRGANRGDLRDHAEFHLAQVRRRFAG